ncbi:MAG: HIT domain-containing protein [Nitrososphaerota archaeon]|nr:HIT domain-containing protein [Nitrososphaerales archaeon]MDW8045512.1 HIT domain-containing protein [Nitrososphaerota archaeon]
MKRIFAPWRIEYIKSDKPKGCIFCEKPKENRDEENYIVYRGLNNFVILNSYPYNPGHLMIVPYKHISSLEGLSKEERDEHFEILVRVVKILKEAMNPDGFNIGMNLGEGAGAGIKDHLHTHVVPRWKEDTNYMPVIADTKVIVEALNSTYKKLREYFIT